MTMPLVSVLIPCFNAERTICETLESVLAQTWPSIEIIVVDDASTDNSVAAVERYAVRGVKLFQQRNAGAASARNRAYRASTGDYIQFLDADDLLGTDKIERQMVRLVDAPGCVASSEWSRFAVSTDNARFLPEPVWRDLPPLDWLALSREEGEGMLFPAIWLVPRSVVEAAGPWDESLSLGDDGEYFTRVVLKSRRILFCAGARSYYRSGTAGTLSGRKTRSAWISAERVLGLCEMHVLAHENSERVRRGFSLSWQHFAHACYPYASDLAERALTRAAALHSVRKDPDGGFIFFVASRLIGWRFARRLQVASGRP